MARGPRRPAVALIDVLAVIAMLGTLMGLFLGALQKVRDSSSRLACQNNMRQIGHAILQFNDQKRYYPPSQDGIASNSNTWLKLILPYVGYESAAPWDAIQLYVCPADREARSLVFESPSALAPSKSTPAMSALCVNGTTSKSAQMTSAYITSSGSIKYACSSYVAVVSSKNVNGPYDAVMYPLSRTRSTDITDGSSNTVIVGERPPSRDLVWGWWASPFRGDVTMGSANMYQFPIVTLGRASSTSPGTNTAVNCPAVPYFGPGTLDHVCDVQHFWSLHPFGANWLFADGSVQFIQYRAALQIPKLSTRADSDVIDWLEVF